MSIRKTLRRLIEKVKTPKEIKLYKSRLGQLRVKSAQNGSLVAYEKNGTFDYETYKQIQELGNKRKLHSAGLNLTLKKNIIRQISEYALKDTKIGFALCHGTRNGAEQQFFKDNLPDAEVLGTEISETALQFPNTIEWDFHEVKPEWIGSCDLIYSNSWDHTYDPVKLFKAWGSCVSKGGLMAIEHTVGHEADKVDALDPFGTTFQGLVDLVTGNTSLKFENVIEIGGKNNRRIALFRRPA